jgi:hypothetical protein
MNICIVVILLSVENKEEVKVGPSRRRMKIFSKSSKEEY